MFLQLSRSDPATHPTSIHPPENPHTLPTTSQLGTNPIPDLPRMEDTVLSPMEDDDDYGGFLNDGVGNDFDEDNGGGADEDDPALNAEPAPRPRRTARPLLAC
jgi:hypothetical protein